MKKFWIIITFVLISSCARYKNQSDNERLDLGNVSPPGVFCLDEFAKIIVSANQEKNPSILRKIFPYDICEEMARTLMLDHYFGDRDDFFRATINNNSDWRIEEIIRVDDVDDIDDLYPAKRLEKTNLMFSPSPLGEVTLRFELDGLELYYSAFFSVDYEGRFVIPYLKWMHPSVEDDIVDHQNESDIRATTVEDFGATIVEALRKDQPELLSRIIPLQTSEAMSAIVVASEYLPRMMDADFFPSEFQIEIIPIDSLEELDLHPGEREQFQKEFDHATNLIREIEGVRFEWRPVPEGMILVRDRDNLSRPRRGQSYTAIRSWLYGKDTDGNYVFPTLQIVPET